MRSPSLRPSQSRQSHQAGAMKLSPRPSLGAPKDSLGMPTLSPANSRRSSALLDAKKHCGEHKTCRVIDHGQLKKLTLPHQHASEHSGCQSYECGNAPPFDENFYDPELKRRGMTIVQTRQFIRALNDICKRTTPTCCCLTGGCMIMCGVCTCTCCCVTSIQENATRRRADLFKDVCRGWTKRVGKKLGIHAVCTVETRHLKKYTMLTDTGLKYHDVLDIYVDLNFVNSGPSRPVKKPKAMPIKFTNIDFETDSVRDSSSSIALDLLLAGIMDGDDSSEPVDLLIQRKTDMVPALQRPTSSGGRRTKKTRYAALANPSSANSRMTNRRIKGAVSVGDMHLRKGTAVHKRMSIQKKSIPAKRATIRSRHNPNPGRQQMWV